MVFIRYLTGSRLGACAGSKRGAVTLVGVGPASAYARSIPPPGRYVGTCVLGYLCTVPSSTYSYVIISAGQNFHLQTSTFSNTRPPKSSTTSIDNTHTGVSTSLHTRLGRFVDQSTGQRSRRANNDTRMGPSKPYPAPATPATATATAIATATATATAITIANQAL